MKKHILLIFSLISILGFSLVGCTNNDKVNKNTEKETHSIIEVNNTQKEEEKYVSILENKKTYNELNEEEQGIFLKLISQWDSKSIDFKNKYSEKKEILRQQMIKENEKQEKENKINYSNLIKDIENDFPSMKVKTISGDKDGNNKSLSINMKFLENLDNTQLECATMIVSKEKVLKNNEIESIMISIYNDNKFSGMVVFTLEDGQYNVKANSLKQ
ncbi:hypothetical protein ACTFIN_15170 [Clostridium cagae]|uniref:hypothetical protein n=1 Tax=Clostridium cagae TaxID=2080751 RepID=UPI003F758234